MLTCSGIEVLSDCIKPLLPKETWHPGIEENKTVDSEKPTYSVNYLALCKRPCIFSYILPQDTSVLYFCCIFSVMDWILVQHKLLQGLWFLSINCLISIYITVLCSTPSEARPPSQSKPLESQDSAVMTFDASQLLTGVWSDITKLAQRTNPIYLS